MQGSEVLSSEKTVGVEVSKGGVGEGSGPELGGSFLSKHSKSLRKGGKQGNDVIGLGVTDSLDWYVGQ